MKTISKSLVCGSLTLLFCGSMCGCAGSRLRNFVTGNPSADYQSLEELEQDKLDSEKTDEAAAEKSLLAEDSSEKEPDSTEDAVTEDKPSRFSISRGIAAISPFGRKKDEQVSATDDAESLSSDSDVTDQELNGTKEDDGAVDRLLAAGKKRKAPKEDPFLATVSAQSSSDADEEETESDPEQPSDKTSDADFVAKATDNLRTQAASLEREIQDAGSSSAAETEALFAELTAEKESPASAAEEALETEEADAAAELKKAGGSLRDLEKMLAKEKSPLQTAESDADAETDSEQASEFEGFYDAMMADTNDTAAKVAAKKTSEIRGAAEKSMQPATDAAGLFEELASAESDPVPVNKSKKMTDAIARGAGAFDSLFGESESDSESRSGRANIAAESGAKDPFAAAAEMMEKKVSQETGFNWNVAAKTARTVKETAAAGERWWGTSGNAADSSAPAEGSEQNSGDSKFNQLVAAASPSSDSSPFFTEHTTSRKSSADSNARTGSAGIKSVTMPPIRVVSSSKELPAAETSNGGLQGDDFFQSAGAGASTAQVNAVPEVTDGTASAAATASGRASVTNATAAQSSGWLSVGSARTWVMVLGGIIVAILLFAPNRKKAINAVH